MDLPTALLESTRAVASAYIWSQAIEDGSRLIGFFGLIGCIFALGRWITEQVRRP
jgi:hypothetical protein